MVDSSSLKAYFDKHPLIGGETEFTRIYKGYSGDGKYIASNREGSPRYLLRTYPMEQDPGRRLEFSGLQMMEAQNVNCSRPVEIGTAPELGIGYILATYIEGNDAADELPGLSEEEQYRIGETAGLELCKITQVHCPHPLPSWEERVIAKHRRYREKYAACGVRAYHEPELLAFIDDHLHLIQDRPNRFQHDDFHIGNLIVKDGKLAGVIDFNRYDWGDPIHEFVKVGMFSAEVSVPFCVGQIQGYHRHVEPDETFWQLYSLYLAMTLVSSVVWVLQYKPEELDAMLERIARVMHDHDDFRLTVPKWYSENKDKYSTVV